MKIMVGKNMKTCMIASGFEHGFKLLDGFRNCLYKRQELTIKNIRPQPNMVESGC